MGEENTTAMTLYINGEPYNLGDNSGLPTLTTLPDAELPAIFQGGITGAAACLSIAFSAVLEAWRRVAEQATVIIQALADAIHTVTLFERAMEAAEQERPKWIMIYRRTKKARIRKKYHKRIMTWYLEEVAARECPET